MGVFNRHSDEPNGFHNSGVVNTGSMGNVQNQPGAVGSSQRQANLATGDDAAARWPEAMTRLERALADEESRVTDPELCRGLLTMLRGLDISGEQGRQRADSFLGELVERCGGAPGIASIINSAVSLVRAAVG